MPATWAQSESVNDTVSSTRFGHTVDGFPSEGTCIKPVAAMAAFKGARLNAPGNSLDQSERLGAGNGF